MSEMRRSLWGPAAWTFLHASAAVTDDPQSFSQMLRLLERTLPCDECKQHCRAFFERRAPEAEISDAATASRYLFEFHNDVNMRTGKPLAPERVVEVRYGVSLPAPPRPQARFERVRPYRLF